MELLDSRCSVCTKMLCQCSKCALKDKMKKKQARQAAAVAKLADPVVASTANHAEHPSGSSIVVVIPDHIAQLTDSEIDQVLGSSPLKASPTARRIPAVALPQRLAQNDAKVPSVAVNFKDAKDAPKYNLRNILKSFPHDWKMTKIPRFGHCLFESIALAFRKLKRPDELPQTFQELRSVCSKQLLYWKGIIPNFGECNPLLFNDQGIAKVQINRGDEKEVDVTLQEYCELISTSLYGGFDEIMIIVQLFKVQIHVYHDQSYTGGEPAPVQIFMVDPTLPETHEVNSGNFLHINASECCLKLFHVHGFTCFWRLHMVLELVITRRS